MDTIIGCMDHKSVSMDHGIDYTRLMRAAPACECDQNFIGNGVMSMIVCVRENSI